MTLYSEEVGSTTQAAFYPVNALRNRALKQAKTEVRCIASRRSAAGMSGSSTLSVRVDAAWPGSCCMRLPCSQADGLSRRRFGALTQCGDSAAHQTVTKRCLQYMNMSCF